MTNGKKGLTNVIAEYLPIALAVGLSVLVFSVLLYINVLIGAIFALIVAVIAVMLITRTVRKRISVESRIKRTCKKQGYRFTRKRGLMSSFKWNTRDADFTVVAGGYTYYVHYLTVKNYRSALIFENKSAITNLIKPIKNIFNTALNVQEYTESYPTDFPPLPEESYGKRAVRVILVNPVCSEMYERDRDGGLVSTGNGMEKFG